MKPLTKKLRADTGATLIIALVFMLFCIFVGGTVLASATANSARLKRTIADDQEYLQIRSAAMLLADELLSGPQPAFQVNFDEIDSEVGEGEDAPEGAAAEPGYELVCTLSGNGSSDVRDLLYLCAGARYYADHSDRRTYSFDEAPLKDAAYNLFAENETNDVIQSAIALELKLASDEKVDTAARMECDSGYNIHIYFLNADGKVNPKLHIDLFASQQENTDQLIVTWGKPQIVRGGYVQNEEAD